MTYITKCETEYIWLVRDRLYISLRSNTERLNIEYDSTFEYDLASNDWMLNGTQRQKKLNVQRARIRNFNLHVLIWASQQICKIFKIFCHFLFCCTHGGGGEGLPGLASACLQYFIPNISSRWKLKNGASFQYYILVILKN